MSSVLREGKGRGPNTWKRSELIRAMRAAKEAGASVSRVEIEGGKISVVLTNETGRTHHPRSKGSVSHASRGA